MNDLGVKMKKFLLTTALCLSVASTSAMAQSAPQPVMSSTDVEMGIDHVDAGILVPIMVMIFFLSISGHGHGSYAFASDERLKTNIHPVGQTANGLTLYEFSYRDRPGTYRGVMAQEVQQIMPSAVVEHESGFLYVNYDALGIEMEQIN